jgi:tetratricopeptide (TPR) repeat protein
VLGQIASLMFLICALPIAVEAQNADQLVEDGVILLQDGEYRAAERTLRAAHEIAPSPRAAYNLSTALIALGRLVEAVEMLETLTREPITDWSMASAAQARLAEIRPRLARAPVRVIGSAGAGHAVAIDDRPLRPEALGTTVAVDAGLHRITLSSTSGEVIRTREVYVAEGSHSDVDLDMHALRAGVPLPAAVREHEAARERRTRALDPETDEPGLLSRWWFWTGAAAVVAGAVVVALLVTADAAAVAPSTGTAGTITFGGR